MSLSLLLFLKCRWQFLLRQAALFLSSLPSVVQDLARFFFVPIKILFPGSGLRCCGRGCAVCWVWVQLCPSTSAAGAVAIGAATAMAAGAGDPPAVPGVPGPMQRQVDSRSRGRQRRSPSDGFDWREVSQVAVSFACAFFSSSGKYYRFFEVMDQVFFRPLLVAPSLEAPQRGCTRFCG